MTQVRRLGLERKLRRRLHMWRVGSITFALLVFPFAHIGMEHVLLKKRAMSQYSDCRSTKYLRLWYCACGDDRNRWTEPLQDRERRIWESVLARARGFGMTFRDPVPVRTNAEADLIARPPVGKIYAEAFPSGRIVFSTQDMDRMSDDEVAILMAHELGHALDMQSERTGYPLLNRLAYADSETVAWGIAAMLYSAGDVERFRQNWQSEFFWYD